jgi:hypothetical protein
VYPWPAPTGERNLSLAPYFGRYPFYQHTHRYDVTLGDRFVPFVENGRAHTQREPYSQFYDTLQRLGTQQVYLEFANTRAHGYARYTLDVRGEPETYVGMVQNGFPARMAHGTQMYRTKPFRASDLRTFTVDVRSLRGLQKLWDGQRGTAGTCSYGQWPMCVGSTSGRNGALIVRIRKSSGQLLYEGSMYWHMQEAEHAQHLQEEAMWRQAIQNGQQFGTALRMGRHAKLYFNMDPIEAIGNRLGFDDPELIHVGTWAAHESFDELVGSGPLGGDGGGTGGGTGGGGPLVTLCHRSGQGQTTLSLIQAAALAHLRHGDRLGPCTGGSGSGGSGG